MTASQWFSLSADLSLIALLLFLWARLARKQHARPKAARWPSRRVS